MQRVISAMIGNSPARRRERWRAASSWSAHRWPPAQTAAAVQACVVKPPRPPLGTAATAALCAAVDPAPSGAARKTHNLATIFIRSRSYCRRRRGAPADKLQVKAANILPLSGIAGSEQDPLTRGHSAQYLYRAPSAGARATQACNPKYQICFKDATGFPINKLSQLLSPMLPWWKVA